MPDMAISYSPGTPEREYSHEGTAVENVGMALVLNVFERQQALDEGDPEKARVYQNSIDSLSQKLKDEFSIDAGEYLYEVMSALEKHWQGNK